MFLKIHKTFNRNWLYDKLHLNRPPDKTVKIIYLIFEAKHMLWVLKRTVSSTQNRWVRKYLQLFAEIFCQSGPMPKVSFGYTNGPKSGRQEKQMLTK